MSASAATALSASRRQRAGTEQRLHELEMYLDHLQNVPQTGRRSHSPDSLTELLHRSYLVSLVMVLEGELKKYSDLLEHYHPAPAEVALAGSVLDRFKKRLTRRYGFKHLVRQQIWRDLKGLYQIRTSLLHDDGQLADLSSRKRALIAAFAAQHNTPHLAGNRMQVEWATCQVGLVLVRQFLAAIYDEADRLLGRAV